MNGRPDPAAGWQELTKSACFELLAGQDVGRVAAADAYGPVVLPVNYVLDRHMVVFRTGRGTKLGAAGARPWVAFEIDGTDARTCTGWSVLVRGEAVEVTDPAELARLRDLPLYPWAPEPKSHYVRLLPARVTGRRITAATENAGLPAADRIDDDEVRPWEQTSARKSSAETNTRASRNGWSNA